MTYSKNLQAQLIQKLYLKKNIDIEKCKRSLSYFIKQAWHIIEPRQEYVPNWHIDAVCEHLEAITLGQIKRLLVNIPPGTMKTLMTSVFFPAWEWGPRGLAHMRYISASHNQTLALSNNVKTRRLISSEWYQNRWEIELMKDQDTKTKFENTQTGLREALAADSMTGARGDRVIIDDPHSVSSASSDKERQSTLDWFTESVPTRLVNPDSSAIIVIMQRLHEKDVSGLILEQELGYEHLCLPMRFDPLRRCTTSIFFTDPRTYEGELLFPQRFPERVVAGLEKTLGSIAAAGQLDQLPAPAKGNIFKNEWFGVFYSVKKYQRIVISLDTASKAQELNDPTCATVWGVHTDGYDLLEIVLDRFIYPDLKKMIVKLAEKYKNQEYYAGHTLFTILIEDKASGISLIQDLRKDTNLNIVAIEPSSDKVTRASTCSPQIENGKVFLKANADYTQAYLKELCVFPNTSHDDQVDSTSQFLNWISTNVSGNIHDIYLD